MVTRKMHKTTCYGGAGWVLLKTISVNLYISVCGSSIAVFAIVCVLIFDMKSSERVDY